MQKQNFIVFGDFEEFCQGGFGVVEDLGGGRGAVRDFGEGEAGVVVVEEGGGAGGEDGGGERGRAGAEVGYLFAGWHCEVGGLVCLSGVESSM